MPIGPSRPLILHTPEAIDLRQAARYLGAQRQPDDATLALLGLSDHPVTGQPAGCGHCALRARCDYRKRGITCADQ